ncbi:MAG: hypothetical protein ABSD29_00755 [Verrucomicrobiota bacterium]|jgi:hypothetical protein
MSTGGAEGYFEFFREELIPDGLQLVLDVWRKLPSSTKAGKEDEITGRLAAAMKREKKARRLGFSIHFQAIPLGPYGPVAARIDFKFLASFDEDAYFAFECKRLRIPQPSGLDHNTDSYVGCEGMGRFIIGKYASGQPHGAMIGYVMDGDIAMAKSAVIALVHARKTELKLTSGPTWEDSRFLPSETDVHQTRHCRELNTGAGAAFTLQHMFLSV